MVLISQRKIHRTAQSENWSERREAAKLLGSNFQVLPDKEQAWNDLHRLTLDKVSDVRAEAVHSLGIAFPAIPNKKLAWKDMHRLTQIKDVDVREYAALALGYAFSHIPDKEQAWNDLQRLAQDEEPEVLESAAMSLNAAFPDISNKEQAWEHLVRLAQYNDYDVLFAAIDALGDVYCDILDKEQALKDIFWLTQDGEEDFGRWRAVYALGAAFPHNPNKQWAWEDIHQLTQYDDKDIREGSAYVLGTIFPYIPDKEQAWLDLHRLTLDGVNYVRKNAVLALGFAFVHIPDKEQACADLHRLMEDSDEYVRYGAAIALGSVFSHLSDKEPAWKDLTRLVQDKTGYVQSAAVISLGIVFPHVPDKKLAWDILHLMTRYVHDASAVAIGLAFPCIPDEKQAWKDLIWLAQDKDKDVRGSANYSLGKASIFKATEVESEEDFRKKLEKALEFFEKSSKDATYNNPAIFCLPFYRSFYTITFKKQDAKIEVQKYLTEAKIASEGSESREKLLDAVENLANALKEVQEASDKGFNTMKCDLNAYRRYCERATDLLEITEEKAPGATKLIRKGLPIIDQRIKELLGEIEEKAKKLCKESQKTPFEKISRNAYEHVKGLGETENPIKAEISLNGLAPLLRSMCHILPEESRGVICNQLDEMEESELSDKARIIGSALSSIQPQIINLQEKLAERERWIEYFKNLVIQRLDNINYGVFQLKIRSGEIVPKLHEIQDELKKLIIIKTDLDNIGLNIKDLGDLQHYDIQKVNDGITLLCRKIETGIIPELPKANDDHRIIDIQKKIQDLKQSKEEVWFNRVAGLSSIIGLILTIL